METVMTKIWKLFHNVHWNVEPEMWLRNVDAMIITWIMFWTKQVRTCVITCSIILHWSVTEVSVLRWVKDCDMQWTDVLLQVPLRCATWTSPFSVRLYMQKVSCSIGNQQAVLFLCSHRLWLWWQSDFLTCLAVNLILWYMYTKRRKQLSINKEVAGCPILSPHSGLDSEDCSCSELCEQTNFEPKLSFADLYTVNLEMFVLTNTSKDQLQVTVYLLVLWCLSHIPKKNHKAKAKLPHPSG